MACIVSPIVFIVIQSYSSASSSFSTSRPLNSTQWRFLIWRLPAVSVPSDLRIAATMIAYVLSAFGNAFIRVAGVISGFARFHRQPYSSKCAHGRAGAFLSFGAEVSFK